jgi:uncharacterized membrane protein HdeD (DUF308 family)
MTSTSQTIAGEEAPVSPFPWWTSLLLGVFSVIFGIVVLAWPGLSLRVMAALVGVWLLLAGLFRIVGAFLPGGRGLARSVLSGLAPGETVVLDAPDTLEDGDKVRIAGE